MEVTDKYQIKMAQLQTAMAVTKHVGQTVKVFREGGRTPEDTLNEIMNIMRDWYKRDEADLNKVKAALEKKSRSSLKEFKKAKR